MFLGLEVGSWAEWFGAIASFLAVLVALFLPYIDKRDKVKITVIRYVNDKDSDRMGVKIEIYNRGSTPFLIKTAGFLKDDTVYKASGVEKYLDSKDVCGFFYPVDENSIKWFFAESEKIVVYPCIVAGSGSVLKGKEIVIKKEILEKEIEDVRERGSLL
ncbi:hypothetical protein GQS62_04565 [Pediococcus pentosaceus]|uniref:hypothetical protein n=1 Tax=Pediococcus pentosaceus TaxID=1255 RepID=UPI001303C83C|nr:hypothetical protein [Pediococcus pentosaceus]QGZ70120.1 hypothetical protein GQS62_04565 [Pediococcus pentosaceus]